MAIIIDVKVKAGQSARQIDKLRESLDKLAQTYRVAGAAQHSFGTLSAVQAQKIRAATPKVTPPPRMPAGPLRGLGGAQAALQSAIASGNPTAIFDAQYRLRQAQNRAQRAQNAMAPPDPNKDFMQALMRTRFGTGMLGGLKGMPLGRDIMKLGGMGSQAVQALMGGGGLAKMAPMLGTLLTNPITIAAITVAASAAASAALGVNALRIQGKYLSGYAVAGGTNGALRNANLIAGATGMGSGADAARRLQSGIGSGGIGMAYAAQAGINPIGGPFGDMNYAEKLRRYNQFVMKSRSFDEARRRAEAAGTPELAQNYFLSDESKGRLNRLGAGAMNPARMRETAEFRLRLAEVNDQLDQLQMKLGANGIPLVMNALKAIGPSLDRTVAVLNAANEVNEAIMSAIRWMAAKLGLDMTESDQQSREKHRKAMEEHTRAMKDHREVIGGGARAQNAIPKGIRGDINGWDAIAGSRINVL